ncbi:hypothetical protein BS50DRAFT_221014 [Corynespora cassiicola Philippines]|uniref:Uncharacterized protein n=1 Tax=Corynespora cassiicola Philippines TaxID=1448308 RepID=A0A2T2N3P4_CORCC|nr:hypothetical protein BS50DRAFT_221014 [Corynespora cassiicola Philippines]
MILYNRDERACGLPCLSPSPAQPRSSPALPTSAHRRLRLPHCGSLAHKSARPSPACSEAVFLSYAGFLFGSVHVTCCKVLTDMPASHALGASLSMGLSPSTATPCPKTVSLSLSLSPSIPWPRTHDPEKPQTTTIAAAAAMCDRPTHPLS